MSEHGKKYYEAVERREETAKKESKEFIDPYQLWFSGFWWGWREAMDAKFDDRKALKKWAHSSKHVFCPCNEETSCTTSCPHGRMYMSGYCKWCAEKYEEIEKECIN